MKQGMMDAQKRYAAFDDLPLSSGQREQFAIYTRELQRWNEHVNLTAITDSEQIQLRHFLDSLTCANYWSNTPHALVDIGSGAGFPGIPLKLVYSDLHLTLIESVGKKVTFLKHLVAELNLSSVTVLHARAEEVGRDPHHRGVYAVATARAVAEVRVLAEYALPLLQIGGRLLAPKGADVVQEVDTARYALTVLGGKLLGIEPVVLPGLDPRSIVIIEKTAATPAHYPRAVGIPARRPL